MDGRTQALHFCFFLITRRQNRVRKLVNNKYNPFGRFSSLQKKLQQLKITYLNTFKMTYSLFSVVSYFLSVYKINPLFVFPYADLHIFRADSKLLRITKTYLIEIYLFNPKTFSSPRPV